MHCGECRLSHFNCVRLFVTWWTIACQAPLSMGFSRQEYWSGLPCPPPRDLLDPGAQPTPSEAHALPVDSLPLSHQEAPSSGERATLGCRVQASHCGGLSRVEHRLCGLWAPGVAAWGLQSTGSVAVWRELQLLHSMWYLPGPGIQPMSPAFVGRFLSTVPAGKSCI